ncbi:hypothetical protein BN946_scf184983.g42 [Trametes cinnabarina]|uniref:NACHT domain-containing protein n=1 Tax=Pycnoporus cinnabarinus TaxID=5643 RepID=A0A060SJZ8_PYCCI|nr:hypothetical protein BN946_scf184983.g42 [Trametes cinnabarina]
MAPRDFALKDTSLLQKREDLTNKNDPADTPPSSLAVSSQQGRLSKATAPGFQARETVKATFGGLIAVLKVTEQVASAHPALQMAVGAILRVLEAYEKSSARTEAVKTLHGYIIWLNNMLENVLSADSTDMQDCVPPALQARLDQFSRHQAKRKLQLVSEELERIKSHNLLVRMLKNADYDEKVEECVKTLSWHIHSFLVEGVIAVELAVQGMKQEMRTGFDRMDNRFKQVHQGIEEVRHDVNKLAADFPNSSILWIHGLAGFGKSTLAQTVAQWWDEDKILGATFFCARDGDRSDVRCIYRTIAYQLACRFPGFHDALLDVLKADPDVSASFPVQQLKKLIVEPLSVAKARGGFPHRIVVVIDALDECTDEGAVSIILKSLSQHVSELQPLRFVITSRPEENISRGFLLEALRANAQHLSLTEIPEALAKQDVSNFLAKRLEDIRERYSLPPDWPPRPEFDALLNIAGALFIFATTAILFIGDDGVRNPAHQLTKLVEAGDSAVSTTGRKSTPALRKLDALYEQVLARAAEKLDDTARARLKVILGTVTLAEELLSPASIDILLDLNLGDVRRILPVLNAVVNMPPQGDEHTPIRLIHSSFPNFLVDPSRCTSPRFLINPPIHHTYIALRCLKTMQSLKHNICGTSWVHDDLLNVDIPGLPDRIAQNLPSALQYACKYWAFHLRRAEFNEELLAALEDFCKTHLLHWLEALSLMGCNTSLPLPHTNTPELLYDCERVVRAFYLAISVSALQVYKTVLVFCPTDSLVRRLHAAEARSLVQFLRGAEKAWSTTLSSTPSPGGAITALDFSSDERYIVSGHRFSAVVWLWSTQTGTGLVAFEGHTGHICSVSFSPTAKEFLSGSGDTTVKLWDVATATCLATWQKHSEAVSSVAWSLDGALAASGSVDKTVVLWHVTTGEEPLVLLGHEDQVNHVGFAAEGILLSASDDKTCRVWDASSNKPIRVLRHSSSVQRVAASSGGELIACGLVTGDVDIWNQGDGHRLRSLACSRSFNRVISLAFHPDDHLAAAYEHSSCILWSVSSGQLLKDEFNNSQTTAFSQNGLHIAYPSWSDLKEHFLTVREWSPANADKGTQTASTRISARSVGVFKRYYKRALGSMMEKEEGAGEVLGLSLSPDRRLILVAYRHRLGLVNALTGQDTRDIKHSDAQRIAWSSAGDFFACTGQDDAIYLWETKTGRPIATLAGHSMDINALCFTGDEGQQIISASHDGTIRRWNLDVRKDPPETSSEVLFCSDERIDALAVSADGQWILFASRKDSPPYTSSANTFVRPSRKPTESCGWYNVLRLIDAAGHVLWIQNHDGWIFSVAFSEDRTRALAGIDTGKIFLYDLTHLIPSPSDHTMALSARLPFVKEYKFTTLNRYPIFHIKFSPDNRGILTERSYTPLEPNLQPLRRRPAGPASLSAYFLEDDGWLWRVGSDSAHRRICWVSPSFLPRFMKGWAASGNTVAYTQEQGQLILMDVSRA